MTPSEPSDRGEAAGPESSDHPGGLSPSRSTRPWALVQRLRRPIVALAAVGTVLGGLAGWWNGYRAVVTAGTESSGVSTALVPAAPKTSSASDRRMTFAVLPFTGPSGDAEAARMVQLAFESTQAQQETRTNWARVAPRALVAQAMAMPSSIKQLGQVLDVNFLLRGNVVRGAAGYSLDLTVLEVRTEAPLASRSIPFSGGLVNPQVPAGPIDNALGWMTFAALKQEVAAARDKPDAALDARDLTYRAYVESSTENPDRPAAYAKAQRNLDRAIALAPDDVLALMVLAQLNLCECLRTWAPDTREMERIGEAALDKALAIRPESPSLLSLRGWLLLKRGRHDDALLVADQVLARDPDDGETMRLRVIALFKLGRIEQSAAAIPALLNANDTWWTQANVATVRFASGDDAEAIQSARKALVQMSQAERADPLYGIVALVLVAAESRAGRLDRAQAALKDFHAAVPKARGRAEIEAWRPPHAMLPDMPAFWDALRRAGVGA